MKRSNVCLYLALLSIGLNVIGAFHKTYAVLDFAFDTVTTGFAALMLICFFSFRKDTK